MATRTKFVFLMHPKEWKQEKAATGRLTHLCLADSEIHVGVGFDDHGDVQQLLRDPANLCLLLYPGKDAINLSELATGDGQSAISTAPSSHLSPLSSQLHHRQLVIFLLDATWALGRKMLRLSPGLQRLPRIMFTPTSPSRYVIKQQPVAGCLSTLEATHELLLVLQQLGIDRYSDPHQLLALFARMQEFQLQCAADPSRGGYRRRAFRPVAERVPPQGKGGARRTKIFTV